MCVAVYFAGCGWLTRVFELGFVTKMSLEDVHQSDIKLVKISRFEKIKLRIEETQFIQINSFDCLMNSVSKQDTASVDIGTTSTSTS